MIERGQVPREVLAAVDVDQTGVEPRVDARDDDGGEMAVQRFRSDQVFQRRTRFRDVDNRALQCAGKPFEHGSFVLFYLYLIITIIFWA